MRNRHIKRLKQKRARKIPVTLNIRLVYGEKSSSTVQIKENKKW